LTLLPYSLHLSSDHEINSAVAGILDPIPGSKVLSLLNALTVPANSLSAILSDGAPTEAAGQERRRLGSLDACPSYTDPGSGDTTSPELQRPRSTSPPSRTDRYSLEDAGPYSVSIDNSSVGVGQLHPLAVGRRLHRTGIRYDGVTACGKSRVRVSSPSAAILPFRSHSPRPRLDPKRWSTTWPTRPVCREAATT